MSWYISHSIGSKKKKAKSAIGYSGGKAKTTRVNANTVSALANKASIVANKKNKLPSDSISKNAAKNLASSSRKGGNSTDARSQRAKKQKRNESGQFSKSGSSKASLVDGKNLFAVDVAAKAAAKAKAEYKKRNNQKRAKEVLRKRTNAKKKRKANSRITWDNAKIQSFD